MNNKVTLSFEDGKYKVCIDETVVNEDDNIDESFKRFKQIITNNSIKKSSAWEDIEESLNGINLKELQINSDYKTATFGIMKYFYNTSKVFYMTNEELVPLIGGYEFFCFIVNLISKGELNNYENLLELCKFIITSKANYRTSGSTIFVSSAKFSYGSVEYNFSTKKINKGTSLENGDFDEFKSYILSIIN